MAEFSVSKPLQEVSTFLDNYRNREQVFRTVQYASILCSGALETRLPNISARFSALAGSISTMRTTLRLLDDLPNLAQTLVTWKRPKDSSLILLLVDLVSSLSGLLYYPTEHLAWATDMKILHLKSSTRLWNCCVVLWIISLVTSCLRNLATLWHTNQQMRLMKGKSLQSDTAGTISPGKRDGSHGHKRKQVTFQDQSGRSGSNARLRALKVIYTRAAISLVQSLSDMVNAVHFLPPGVLWSGRLPTLMVGLVGTISSLLGLYKILQSHQPRPTHEP